MGGSGFFGAFEGSGAVSRRIGSTRLADMARSNRGDEGSMSLDDLGLAVACLTGGFGSCCPE